MIKKSVFMLAIPLISVSAISSTIDFSELKPPVTLVAGPGHGWTHPSAAGVWTIPSSTSPTDDSSYVILNGGINDGLSTKAAPQKEVVIDFGSGGQSRSYTLSVTDGKFSKTVECHSPTQCKIEGIEPYDGDIEIKVTNSTSDRAKGDRVDKDSSNENDKSQAFININIQLNLTHTP
jgi:hypothetical protein